MKKLLSLVFAFSIAGLTSSVYASKNAVEKNFSLKVSYWGITADSVFIEWNSQFSENKAVHDYAVFVNGKKQKLTAREKAAVTNITNSEYKKAFYDHYTKAVTKLEMVKTDTSFYRVDDLKNQTNYEISVAAIDKKGKQLFKSETISVQTKDSSEILNAEKAGACISEKITDIHNAEEKALIENNTKILQKLIDDCPAGGTVYIPNGIYVSGQLNLKSHMTLKIDGVLCASPYPEHYKFGFLMYKYYTDKRYWGLLSCDGAENLRITGSGCVDGNGWLFADESGAPVDTYQVYSEEGDVDFSKTSSKARKLIRYVKSNNRRIYQDGILSKFCAESYLKSIGKTNEEASKAELGEAYSTRSTTVILKNVKNLLIDGLLFINPANHMINIIDSQNITVTGITELTYNANNGDGVGIICSQNASIYNNFIDTGDDSIVFSSGVGKSAVTTGEKGACNVRIFGNYIHHGHGGVAFGSHTALGIRNVIIEDNVFNHTDIPFRVKSAPANGGEVADVIFNRNAAAWANQAFVLSTEYNDAGTISKYGAADTPAVFHDIICSDSTVSFVNGTTIYISADEKYPHRNITFENVKFSRAGMEPYVRNCENLIIK